MAKFYKVELSITGTYEDIIEAESKEMAIEIAIEDIEREPDLIELTGIENDVWQVQQ